MRTVPVVLEIAERVRERAAPDAWIVDFTNPVGIVTRALLDAGHRAVGLCNVAIGVPARSSRALLGVEPARVAGRPGRAQPPDLGARGAARRRGRARELLADHGDEIAAGRRACRGALLDDLGAIPSYYLRYFYAHDEVLAEQRDGVPRAADRGARSSASCSSMYRDPALDEKPALLERRGGAFYSEAATGLVASLIAGDGAVHVVDMRNDGTLAGLADDDVVEVPARVGAGRAGAAAQAPLAPELLGLVQHVAAYERLAVRAARHGRPASTCARRCSPTR